MAPNNGSTKYDNGGEKVQPRQQKYSSHYMTDSFFFGFKQRKTQSQGDLFFHPFPPNWKKQVPAGLVF